MSNVDRQNWVQGTLFPEEEKTSLRSQREFYADTRKAVVNLLGFSQQEGLGFKSLQNLYDHGVIQGYRGHESDLLYKHVSESVYNPSAEQVKYLVKRRDEVIETGRSYLSELEDRGIRILMAGHPKYPSRLTEIMDDAPRWLFVEGNIDAIGEPSQVALVGTRNPSEKGKYLARRCAAELGKRNFVVVSGLAKGIDSASHEGALDAYAETVAVLGHGLLSGLSADQEELAVRMKEYDGALVSEYLPNDPPSRDGYLRRNSVIAALSKLVIPVECPSMQSGTGSTIRRAKRLGLPVAGIYPENGMEPSKALKATKRNFEQDDIPVLNVFTRNRSRDLWSFLQPIFKEHDWRPSRKRQERFFQEITSKVEEANKYLDMNPSDLDRLRQHLGKVVSNE